MPRIIMLRCYGWLWEDSVENMIRVLDSFIKHMIFSVLAQFFKQSWAVMGLQKWTDSVFMHRLTTY